MKSSSLFLPLLCFTAASFPLAATSAEPQPVRQVATLSPEEELKTIQLPDGYRLELVLSEPEIKEPVLCVFDGNGRMYVAEMRTYMQDIDGKDELTPRSRVSLHESTKGDGVFDKHSVYLDNLLLPRMILPLDDRILLGLTNTSDIMMHRDANGDGVADESSVWFAGGPRGGNLEHQPSGLVWALDNGIYTTYNSYRFRWSAEGKPMQEPTAGNGGQWGAAQDDYGKMWWSNAGGEKGLWNFQTPILYAAINVASQKAPDFDKVWPLVALGDFQGGPNRFQSPENKALNHFTGCAGQTVFRGDRLPEELRGNVFLPEPVGRLIRRATVTLEDGITKLSNPHGNSEFIRSSDPNFRPLNMTTGPDGCLYIVDMYRGIIQEGNWVKEGSFLRERVKENGMQNVVGHGRIWRLVHKDFKPGPQPRMLQETPAQWVEHLTHPNGWWRDTAQRMLIVKGDKSVVPSLTKMAESHANHLARMHALWTLEGLGALSPEFALARLKDSHAQVRAQVIRASESVIKTSKDATHLIAAIRELAKDSDPTVALQSIMTSKLLNWPQWREEAQKNMLVTTSAGVREIAGKLLQEEPKLAGGNYSKQEKAALARGQETYRSLCFACHGFDGKGMPMPGREGVTLAPPLAKSQTVTQGDSLLRVLLHGITGPIDGKTYESQMVSMGNNTDEWLADVASYIRKSFGNQGELVTKEQVHQLRAATKARTVAWTIDELREGFPHPIENRKDWKLTTSHNPASLPLAIDGQSSTRWTTNKEQVPGFWLQIELPSPTELAGVIMDSANSGNDYPRGYTIALSTDGQTWDTPVLQGQGKVGTSEYPFPKTTTARFVKITQTGEVKGKFWSIHELHLLAPGKAAFNKPGAK